MTNTRVIVVASAALLLSGCHPEGLEDGPGVDVDHDTGQLLRVTVQIEEIGEAVGDDRFVVHGFSGDGANVDEALLRALAEACTANPWDALCDDESNYAVSVARSEGRAQVLLQRRVRSGTGIAESTDDAAAFADAVRAACRNVHAGSGCVDSGAFSLVSRTTEPAPIDWRYRMDAADHIADRVPAHTFSVPVWACTVTGGTAPGWTRREWLDWGYHGSITKICGEGHDTTAGVRAHRSPSDCGGGGLPEAKVYGHLYSTRALCEAAPPAVNTGFSTYVPPYTSLVTSYSNPNGGLWLRSATVGKAWDCDSLWCDRNCVQGSFWATYQGCYLAYYDECSTADDCPAGQWCNSGSCEGE